MKENLFLKTVWAGIPIGLVVLFCHADCTAQNPLPSETNLVDALREKILQMRPPPLMTWMQKSV